MPKNVAVIILCFSLVAVICVTSIMMSSSYIKLPTSVLAQGKQNFTANLIGQDEVLPPTNSKATGNSTLILSSDGMNIKYEVNVKDIDNVIAVVQQGKKGESGPVIVTLIRLKALTPTGPVDGLLEGNITADKLQGPLKGKQISDLTTLIDDNNAYVNVLTQQNPEGEIRGQIFD